MATHVEGLGVSCAVSYSIDWISQNNQRTEPSPPMGAPKTGGRQVSQGRRGWPTSRQQLAQGRLSPRDLEEGVVSTPPPLQRRAQPHPQNPQLPWRCAGVGTKPGFWFPHLRLSWFTAAEALSTPLDRVARTLVLPLPTRPSAP